MTKKLNNRLGALSLAISDLVDQAFRANLPVQGSDAHALVLISQKRSLKIDTLARQCRLAHSSTVRLVDRLEKSGYVYRHSGIDKRAVLLSLTTDGAAMVERILKTREDTLAQRLACLDPGEGQLLLGLVNRLLESLTTDAPSGEHICRQCDETACDLETCPVERRYLTMPDAMTGPDV